MNPSRITLTLIVLACCAPLAGALEIEDRTFATENAGKVVFNHSKHLRKKDSKSPNVSCKSCHNDKMRKGVRYTMAQMEEGKSCGMCHNGRKAFALANCTNCHKVRDITYKVAETGPVRFRHSTHLKSSGCGSCHNSLFKAGPNPKVGMAGMEKGKSCGACHNGRMAFSLASCTTCHPVKELRFVVKDAGNVTFSHTSHIGLYKCGECHAGLFGTTRGKTRVSMKEMEDGKSCGACHDGKTGFTVKENCATCHVM